MNALHLTKAGLLTLVAVAALGGCSRRDETATGTSAAPGSAPSTTGSTTTGTGSTSAGAMGASGPASAASSPP